MACFETALISTLTPFNTMDKGDRKVEKLEVEDEEIRRSRIRMLTSKHPNQKNMLNVMPSESYFEKLNSSSRTTNFASQPVLPKKFDFGDRTTFNVKPPTERMWFYISV